MLTLFAIPKAFRGHIDLIQRNAIASWTQLQPRPQIILLGNDPGTAEVAAEFGVMHIPEVDCTNQGTPLVRSLFAIAQQVGNGSLFCYVNADIILLDDFMPVIQQVPFQRFMLTGQRWNVDIAEAIVSTPDWQTQVRAHVATQGVLEGPQAMDYFVFTTNTYTDIPAFAIGRPCWDNWMIYKALSLNIPLIDATQAITAVHQNHDYSHHPQGKQGVYAGEEATQSLNLIGGEHYTYFMLDLAAWQMTPQGLQRARWTWERADRHLDMIPLARPHLKPTYSFLLKLLRRGNHFAATASKVVRIPARIISRLRRSKFSSTDRTK